MARLADCSTDATFEAIDPTLLIAVSLSAPVIQQGTVKIPAIQGTWVAPANPYVVGVQFQYVSQGGQVVKSATQAKAQLTWIETKVIPGTTVSVRYRAVGPNEEVFGAWSEYEPLIVSPNFVSSDTGGIGGRPVDQIPVLDTTPPNQPTGLSGLSSVSQNPSTGAPEIRITWSWNLNTEADLDAYEIEINQGGATFSYLTTKNIYSIPAVAGVTYSARVRARDVAGNNSFWTPPYVVVGIPDNQPPAVPQWVSALASVGSIFLTWTNPSDGDLDAVYIYENTVNNSATATKVGEVRALPGQRGGFTKSGVASGQTRFYWLKAVDQSGNVSGFSASQAAMTALVGTGDFAVNSLSGNVLAAGTVLGDRIIAGTLEGGSFNTNTSLPGSIRVGETGVTIGAVQQQADDPAARVNVKQTAIEPGKILLSGASRLSSWLLGSDQTKMDGGNIGANTIAANVIQIGARGVTFEGLDFTTSGNTISWVSGTANYIDDFGNAVSQSISGGSVAWNTGIGPLYLRWVKGAGSLSTTTIFNQAMGPDRLLVAAYYGGTNMNVLFGRTIIDGSFIKTGSIQADRVVAASLSAISANLGDITAGILRSPSNSYVLNLNAAAERQIFSGGVAYRGEEIGLVSEGIYLWVGPSSITRQNANKGNAWLGLSMNTIGGPRFFGSDVPSSGGSPLAATSSSPLVEGSRPGGGIVSTPSVTITITGTGSENAEVRWIKTQTTGGNIDVYPNGRSASFEGYVAPGGLSRAIFLAVVTVPGGASTTVVQDVQLTDSN